MGRITVTDTMPDLNGHIIDNGRLKLLESLGSGAYGKVYRALDVKSPRDDRVFYAVKCLLRPEPGSDQEAFQDREFALHKLVCGHPNIVTLHRVIYDNEFVYVVLDLCTGGDLFAAITETQIFHNNVQLLKESFIQLIDAVNYCHQKSVFHRDLKPENVLCTEDGSGIRLADFGLSIQSHVSKDFGCGSSYYMSPECIGKELSVGRYSTRHSDVWSLGVILTNMISGRNPWRYATAKDECFAAYLHDRDFLSQVLPISRGANAILKRIFNINPLCRISLLELRREILALDTFFVTEEEPVVNSAARVVQAPSEAHQDFPVPPTDYTAFAVSGNDSEASVSSDEIYAFSSPSDDHTPRCEPTNVPKILSPTATTCSSKIPVSHQSSSGSESDGPITPATRPIDPVIEVPDLPEGQSLYQSPIFSVSSKVNPSGHFASTVKKVPKGRVLLRRAFERIMVLPSGSRTS